MRWQSTPYLVPLLVTAAFAAALGLFVWRRRRAHGANELTIALFALAEWSSTYALSLSATDLSSQLFWANLAYLGLTACVAGWILFALRYVGYRALFRGRSLALLAIEPVALQLLLWTDGSHRLFRSSAQLIQDGPIAVLEVTLGPAFWIHAVYSYALLAIGSFLMLRNLIRTPRLYSRQAATLLIAIATPWFANMLYLSGLSPFPYLDITPIGFTVSVAALAWDVFRYQLFDLAPIARGVVIESLQDAVIVLDTNNRVVDLNPAAGLLLGVDHTTAVGQPAARIFAAYAEAVAPFRTVDSAQAEITVGDDKRQRWFDMRISPLLDDRAESTGRAIVLRDITERKRAEALVRRRNDELVALTQENQRLLEQLQYELAERRLTEVELQAAKERAEQASRAKSAFLANMSHELRTPLTGILGYTELMQRGISISSPDQTAHDLERIHHAGTHLLALINDLLDIAKIESGKMTITTSTIAVSSLVDEVAATIQPLVQRNRNRLIVEQVSALGTMLTDSVKVRQILLNLLSNAAKFTREGTVTLRVDRQRQTRAGDGTAQADGVTDLIVFEVRDTGIGMTEEQIGRLFQPFSQVDSSPSRQYGGTGLGLALSRSLCEMLGGEIAVHSEAGVGSLFTVRLPAGVAPGAP